MFIHEMTEFECRQALQQATVGRLACTRDNQPYVVPIYFAVDREHLYAFTTLGQKVEWMRLNPRVCVEIDERTRHDQWKSVVVFGQYEELPDLPHFEAARVKALELLQKHVMWWEPAAGIVLFAHGSGSSRHSPRNQYVARVIRNSGVGTLLFDLLTRQEEAIDNYTREFRFDINLLARRLIAATEWLAREIEASHLSPGYFGASTGGAAALIAAAELGKKVGAVVSRGGRPDLAGKDLRRVKAPTLLIVGGLDGPVIKMNEDAYEELQCVKELKIVPGATHLFEEPGKLEEVASLAAAWFLKHLR